MRQMTAFYSSTWLKTPTGFNGFQDNAATNSYQKYLGRGIATARSSWYHSNEIWEEKTEHALGYNDLRHDTISRNWMDMENLRYNNPDLLKAGNEQHAKWYGKPLKRYDYNISAAANLARGSTIVNGTANVQNDTIRGWVGWPHYKSLAPDDRVPSQYRGGGSDWYLFRLAETYLLRAEAYVWKGETALALTDINAVRERAGARPFTVAEVSISSILDERARELYFEEPRKSELTRISYIYAKTGKPADDPKFAGKTYTLDKFSTDNYFYDRIMAHNDFYYKSPATQRNENYTIKPYHILWPVRETVINTNVFGRINQNPGYPGNGEAKNQPPIDRAN
jgi:hypothetical protein